MLRRRRRESADQPGPPDDAPQDAGSPDDPDAAGHSPVPRGQGAGGPEDGLGGPWDSAADYPEAERIDCGSLLVPLRDGMDVQINVSEEQGIWVAVVSGGSGIQLQAFAAPRQQGLWDEVRQEIAENVAEAGGTSQEGDGPFGRELHASVRISDDSQPAAEPQPVRFLGADGPRWFLRGLISGPAAEHAANAAPFEEIFSQVVVVRGDHPKPPKEQLDIRLPEEARQALEAQLAADGLTMPEPFQDGPPGTGTG